MRLTSWADCDGQPCKRDWLSQHWQVGGADNKAASQAGVDGSQQPAILALSQRCNLCGMQQIMGCSNALFYGRRHRAFASSNYG